jgi:hypothetical protein
VTWRRFPGISALLLPRPLIGPLLIQVLATPPSRQPVAPPPAARLSTHALVPTRGHCGRKPLPTFATSTPGHRRQRLRQPLAGRTLPGAEWITIAPLGSADSAGAVDHDRAARRITMRAPLKLDKPEPMSEALAKRAGEALAKVPGATTIDAIVMASAAARGDVVYTSDFGDLERLSLEHFRSVPRVFAV